MKLSVATNWSEDIWEKLDTSSIYEFYGSIKFKDIGSGRPAIFYSNISRRQAEEFFKQTHSRGIHFNYLINSLIWHNREFTRKGQRNLRKLLDWLSENDVQRVTVSLPLFLSIIKRNYPNLKVDVSSYSMVTSLRLLKNWLDLGADNIILPVTRLSKDFKKLSEMSQAAPGRLKVIVNLFCAFYCIHNIHHYLYACEASRVDSPAKGFFLDYSRLNCVGNCLVEPINFLRNTFIRPEDLALYERIGIDQFKIVERNLTTDELIRITNAYSQRSYEGNLLDLVTHYPYKSRIRLKSMINFVFKPFKINPLRLARTYKFLKDIGLYIDNKKLDGFLEGMIDIDCDAINCEECGYCQKYVKKAISVDETKRAESIEGFQRFKEELYGGRLFYMKPKK